MSKSKDCVIVVKWVVLVKKGYYGGVWKFVYVDFMIVMMVFFLLMWLLSLVMLV